MKKFIQVCSLLSLLVLFSVAATSAQNNFGADVNIPFAFNVGDRSYAAGNYIVKLDRRASGMATLSIQDTRTDETQTVMLNVGHDDPTGGPVDLVFDKIEGQRYLTKIRTPERTFALNKSRAVKNAAKARSLAKPVEASVGGGADTN